MSPIYHPPMRKRTIALIALIATVLIVLWAYVKVAETSNSVLPLIRMMAK